MPNSTKNLLVLSRGAPLISDYLNSTCEQTIATSIHTNYSRIRERVDARGRVYRLRPPSFYPCLSLPPPDIGGIAPEPLQVWLEGQKTVDAKYGPLRKKFQDQQLQALLKNNQEENLKERGERPPPSALFRRRYKDEIKPTPSRESGLPASLWARYAQKEPKDGEAEEGEAKNVSNSSVTPSVFMFLFSLHFVILYCLILPFLFLISFFFFS